MVLTLALVVLAAGESGEWSSYGKPGRGGAGAKTAAAASGRDVGVPAAAQARYQDAVQKLNARQYGPANDVLNRLAAEYPRVAEIFASRCSAQLGLQHWAAAQADCEYTLKLKDLPNAVYGLAVAEDGQGKHDLAIAHYRQYAAIPEAGPQLKQQANARADLLLAQAGGAAPPPPPPSKKPEPVLAVAPVPPPPPSRVESPPPSGPPPVPPGGGKGQFVPGIPDPDQGLLYVYRNIAMGAGTVVTLYVDNNRVGELWNDRYFEVHLRSGRHTITVKARPADAARPEPESSLDCEIGEGEVNYAKLEYAPQGDDAAFKVLPVGKEGRKEIRSDCELVASKKL